MLPAVPLTWLQREANRAGRRLKKPAPRWARKPSRVSEVRTKPARPFGHANSGRCPVYAGPCGLSVSSCEHRRRQSRTGRLIHRWTGLASCEAAIPAFVPLRCPAGMSKRNEFRSPLLCRDAQRRADKWAGTPDRTLSRPLRSVCQAPSALIRQKRSANTSARAGTRKQAWNIDLHPRAHGRGDRDPVDIMTLGPRRLGLLDGIRKGLDVLDQLVFRE